MLVADKDAALPVGAPDNKAFFEKWGSMVVNYSAQDFVTDG